MRTPSPARRTSRGMALIASLLLLVVVTVLAIAMFRSYGVQERIAGNVREKERALHAAMLAQQYAEYWLTQDNNAAQAPIDCNTLLQAALGQGQICANVMSTTIPGAAISPLQLPWQTTGANPTPVGVQYTPTQGLGTVQMSFNSVLTTTNWQTFGGTYNQQPQFYISDLGPSNVPNQSGEVFQIDAVGWGTTASSVAVIESTFVVGPEVVNLGGL